jgi:hypothetical protein
MPTRPRTPPGRFPSAAAEGSAPLLSTASILALCAALAAATGLVHYQLVDLRVLPGQMNWQRVIVTGQGPYPDQYRVLTYFLADALMRAGMTFAAAHVALRFVFTTAGLFLFHRYVRAWVQPPYALLGLFMAATVLPFTFLFYSMQPTDPLNFLVFVAAFVALERERDAWLLPLVLVGTLNRETALLLPVLYALVRAGRVPLARWLPMAAGAALAGALVYVALRMIYGFKPPYAETSPLRYLVANLRDPSAWIQVFGFFNLWLWTVWKRWQVIPPFLRRAAWLVPVFFVLHLSVGYVREIRYFLPLLPVVIPATLIALQRRTAETPAGAR